MWCIWRQRNEYTFEDSERNNLALKTIFFRTLFDWISVSGLFSFTSLVEFLDHCSLRMYSGTNFDQ